jgi:hypothetical protein
MDPRLVTTVACGAAELFAVWRLIKIGVHRDYPVFTSYLIAGFLQSFIWIAGTPDSHVYVTAYRWTTPFILALQAAVVLELWRGLMSCYRGIHQTSRWLGILILAFGAAVAFSTGFDGLKMWNQPLGRVTFHWLIWGARYLGTILCIISALLAVWAAAFDHGVPRNTIRHAELLSLYFGSQAAGFLVINLIPGTAPMIGLYTTLAAAGCYVAWGVLLTTQGREPIERLMIERKSTRRDLRWVFRRLMPY